MRTVPIHRSDRPHGGRHRHVRTFVVCVCVCVCFFVLCACHHTGVCVYRSCSVAVAFVAILVHLQLHNKSALVFSKRRANNLKVLVSYAQYNSFLVYFGVQWGSTMQQLLGFQRAASGAAAAVINWTCLLSSTVETPAVMWVFSLYMAAPLVMAAAGGLTYLMLRVLRKSRGSFWVDGIFSTSWIVVFLLCVAAACVFVWQVVLSRW